MKKANIQLETLSCPSCLMKINAAVRKVDGVSKDTVDVLFNASKVKVEFDEEVTSVEKINEAINKIGFEVIKSTVK